MLPLKKANLFDIFGKQIGNAVTAMLLCRDGYNA
jgi:hypothetical protein